jgi:hypothetical protein
MKYYKNMNKKLLLSIGLMSVLGMASVQAQSVLNAAFSIVWAWGTNATTTTASGLTGIGAFGTNLINGPALISSISIGNQSAAPIDVAFFDAPPNPLRALYTSDVYTTTNTTFTGTVFWVHPANGAGYGLATWTNTLATVTKITTNYSGVKTTNTGTFQLSGWWTNNMSTNMFRRAYFVTVPPNTTLTPNLGAGLLIGSGLTITNGASATFGNAASNLTISVTYDPSL